MFKLYGRFLKKYRLQVFIGPLFKLTEAVFELIVPLVMAKIIDVGVKNQDTKYILHMGLLLVGLGVAGLLCALVCQSCAAIASQGAGTDIRDALFSHILSFSQSNVDKFGASSLVNRMGGDINNVQVSVAMLIRLVIRAPFLAIGAIVMAMTIDLKISLIFLVSTVIIAAVMYLVMSRSLPHYRTLQKKSDRLFRITQENLTGSRVIRAMSGGGREKARFDDANRDYTGTAIRIAKLSSLLSPMTYAVANIAVVLIIRAGAFRVDAGALTQGRIIALVNYMLQTLAALVVVANLFVIFTKASASVARINEVFAAGSDIEEKAGALYPDTAKDCALEFDNVGFSYGGEKKVLSDVGFKVGRGTTCGIIGGTGSGKSTIAALICRFYDCGSGAVRVFGEDIKDIELQKLRHMVGLVPQKAMLLSGTVADNLRWGSPDATDAELWQALESAQAADFVREKPDGLGYRIAQGAKNLSGGQRQRLTIARALAAKPDILILDDSASALDFLTESRLRHALAGNAYKNMTKIVISQRVASIREADMIIVLDDGRVAGRGKHDDLLADCPLYREICDSQEEK